MPGTDRLTALCEQDSLTGIDFIQIVDPGTQTLLRVFFVIDPDLVVPPWAIIPPLPGSVQCGRHSHRQRHGRRFGRRGRGDGGAF